MAPFEPFKKAFTETINARQETMRAQSAIEAMLIVAAFFLIIGIFAGMYMRFTVKETSLSLNSRMRIDLHRIASAVNDVYVLGPKNSISLELRGDYMLSAQGPLLTLATGQLTANATVFAPVQIQSTGPSLLVENIGGNVVISAE